MKKQLLFTWIWALMLHMFAVQAQPVYDKPVRGIFSSDRAFDDSGARSMPAAVLQWEETLSATDDGVYLFRSSTPVEFTSMVLLWEVQPQHVAVPSEAFTIRYRVRESKGAWSAMTSADAAVAPSDAPRRMYATELIMLSDSRLYDAFEFEITPPQGVVLSKVEVDVIDITRSGGRTASELPAEQTGVKSRSGNVFPEIIRRSSWCLTEACLNPTYTIDYIFPTHTLIHYGAAPDDYTDGAAVVRSYWDYHVNTLGWWDIGYNYLIDKHGNLFEGRHNPELPLQDVRAAHAGASNVVSIGVNFLGNTDALALNPSAVQLEKNIRLLTWWYDHNEFDPTTSASIILQDPAGELGDRFRISGHKDVGNTACPGEVLYAQLPQMRQDVLRRLNTSFYSVGTENVDGEDGHFATFREAVTFLNGLTEFTGDIVMYITSDLTDPGTPGGVGLAVNPSPYTITFKPAPGVTPTITFLYPGDTNAGPSGGFIIGIPHTNNIAWADAAPTRNIIFDGSNTFGGTTRDMTITNTTSTQRNGMPFLMVGDVSDIQIRNMNIYHKATVAANNTQVGFNGALAFRVNHNVATDNAPRNILVDNCHISVDFDGVSAGYNGVNVFKTGSGSNGYIHNIAFTNNLIEGKANGFFLAWAGDNILIEGNEIRQNQNLSAGIGANAAVQLPLTLAGANIEVSRNFITRVANIGNNAISNTAAIDIAAGGNYLVANNMITGFDITATENFAGALRGIRINNAAAQVLIAYNTLLLNDLENITGTSLLTYRGIDLDAGNVMLANNIIATSENDFEFNLLDLVVLPEEMDYNLYFFEESSQATIGGHGSEVYTDLEAWQAATGKDSNSLFADPMFVSDTDLMIQDTSPAKNAAFPIEEVTVDIFGTQRDALEPCIGAHENLTVFFAGVYSVGAESVEGEAGNFPTFREAVTALNTMASFTEDVTLFITSDLTEDCTVSGIGLAVDPSPYTITIKPAPNKTPTITFHYPGDVNAGPSGAFILGITHANNLAWADATPTRNIIFDGSNTEGGTTRDLTFQNSAGTHRNGMPFLLIGDVSDILIKNMNIYHQATNQPSPTQVGFNGALAFRVNHNVAENNAPRNIGVDNCHISADFPNVSPGYNGVNVFKSGTGENGYLTDISITNSLIEGKANGLFLAWLGTNVMIAGNDIRMNQNLGTGVLANAALQFPLGLPDAQIMVAANTFPQVATLGTAANVNSAAIDILAGGNYLIANNMITGFDLLGTAGFAGNLRGLRINNASANVLLAYNSMLLNELPEITGTTDLNYKGVDLIAGNVLMLNNIIAGEEAGFAYHLLDMTVLAEMNHNLYFYPTGAPAMLGKYNGVSYNNLAAWQNATSGDANSLFADPLFVSSANLMIQDLSPAKAAGTPIEGVTVDMFGTERDAENPCMGAHENLSVVEFYTVTFVVEDQDENPIINAVITLGAATNPEGNYVFGNLPAGTYTYAVTAQGFESVSGSLEVIDQDVTVEVTMMEVIIPTYSVTFEIKDAEGVSVADAIVTLDGDANAPGDYLFEGLEAGTYAYSVVAEGFQEATGSVVITDADVVEIVTLTPVSVPTYTLTFVPEDIEGNLITTSIITFNGVTNTMGDYVFEDIPEGVYTFSIVTEGYFDVTGALHLNQNLEFQVVLYVDDTSVGQDIPSEMLSVFPNPARDVVTIRAASSIRTLSIADMSGRILFNVGNLNTQEHQLNLSQFENGVYLIHVYTDQGVSMQKLQVRK